MKKEDIQVGALYVNKHDTECLYLGIGRRVMWQGTFRNTDAEFTDKNLVIFKGPSGHAGQIVQNPEDCFDGFWDSFEKVD